MSSFGFVAVLPFLGIFRQVVTSSEIIILPFFKSFNAEAGTLGVLTGSIGELVRDRDPKNREGFSGLTFFCVFVVSNLARPFATAPEKQKLICLVQSLNCVSVKFCFNIIDGILQSIRFLLKDVLGCHSTQLHSIVNN